MLILGLMQSQNHKLERFFFWISRSLGSLVLGFLLLFVVAHLFDDSENNEGFKNIKEVILFILFPVSSIIGLFVAYKWEKLGASICLVGFIAFLMIDFSIAKTSTSGALLSAQCFT